MNHNTNSRRTHGQSSDSSQHTVFNAPIRGYVNSATNAGVVTGSIQIFYIQIGSTGSGNIFSDSAPDHQSGQEIHDLISAIIRQQDQEARRREEANATSGQHGRGHPARARSL